MSKMGEAVRAEKHAPAGVFGYPAGKSIIVAKLAPLVTPHRVYTEPFCGSAALFFKKEPSEVECLNDLNPEVAHAYETMKNLSDADMAKLEKLNWTATKEAYDRIKKSKPAEKLARLHRFLYVLKFSHGRMQGGYAHNLDGQTSKLPERVNKWRARLAKVDVRCADYAEVLKEFDGKDAFHFLDPPYVGYDVSIGEKTFDEAKLRKVLDGLKGRFLLTYGVKGKLDTSGYHVKKLNQPRTIARADHVGGSSVLTHLVVSNYEIQQKSLEDIELEDVEAVVQHDGDRTMVFLSAGATIEPEVAAAQLEATPIDATFGVGVAKGVVIGTLGLNGSALTFDLTALGGRSPVDAEELKKWFSADGSRFFRAMTKGVVVSHELADKFGKMVTDEGGEWQALQHPMVEHGLRSSTSREFFVSKGSWGDPVFVGRLRVMKVSDDLAFALGVEKGTTIAKLEHEDLLPWALRKGAPMPPPGVSAIPVALENVVPEAFRYWEARGDEAILKRDALIASGFFGHGSVALVDGEFARVEHETVLYEPRIEKSKADTLSEIELIEKLLPEGHVLRECFGPIGKTATGEVLYIDACAVEVADLDVFNGVLERAMNHENEFVIAAVDANHVRSAMAKAGRPFQFVPGGEVGIDAAKRVFVASFPVAGVAWADVRKDDLVVSELDAGGTLQPSSSSDCVAEQMAAGLSEEEATKVCAAKNKAKKAESDPEPRELSKVDKFLARAREVVFAPHVVTKAEKAEAADERYVLGIVLEPDVEDAQFDIYSDAEVREAAFKFMQESQQIGLMHSEIIGGGVDKKQRATVIVESYLAPVDFELGGQKVKKGTWLLGQKIVDDSLWKAIKGGQLTGLSIGGSAQRTPTGKSDGGKIKKTKYQGIDVHVDRPKGFVQRGTDESGAEWERTYKNDYGEIPGTLGGDGEGLDVFLGPDEQAGTAYWAIQKKADGRFDEYKVMLGCPTEKDARGIYADHIPEKFLHEMKSTSVEKIKALRGIEPKLRLEKIRKLLSESDS